MNFLSTGVKEITRRLRRQKNRLALANARKLVDRSEIALGRSGWRALEGDEFVHEAFQEMHRLDGEVAEANAHISGIEAKVREHEGARDQARREHADALAAIDDERRPIDQHLAEVQARLAEHGKILHEQNLRKQALNTEQTALLKEEKRLRRKSLLLSEEERTGRQQRFEESRAALSEQAAQLAAARSAAVEPMAADEQAIKEIRAAISLLDQRTVKARDELAIRERASALAIAGLHKEIAAKRRQAGRLEDEKEDSYLAIGRRLAAREAGPDGTDDLFGTAKRHRQGYERLISLDAAWHKESQSADKQDLRIFNFVAVTTALLIAIALLLVFRSPGKRDWLPLNTEAVLTLDVRGFTEADFTRALEAEEPDAWKAVWTGLVRSVAAVPQIDVRRQVSRITRALAPRTGSEPAVDCLLVEMRPSVDVNSLVSKELTSMPGGFRPRSVSGLNLYEKGDLAVAQIGPDTLALGSPDSVEALIRVRLGLRDDLKSDAQFFSEFQRLGENSAFRLVINGKTDNGKNQLTNLADTLLSAPLLNSCDALGLTLDMHEPVSVVFILTAANAQATGQVAHLLETSPDQVLQLQSAGVNLFIEPPSVRQQNGQVEWRFRMTSPAAREFLQRVSRLELTPGTADPRVAAAKK